MFSFLIIGASNSLNENYSDNQINTTNFTGKYNQIEKINNTVDDMYQNFQKLGAEDTSWFSKIGAGIVAIPYAVVNFPIMIVTAVSAILSMMVISLGGFVPATILIGMITFIIIEVVRRFLEFFQRSRA